MKRLLLALALFLFSAPAFASDCWNNVAATQTNCGVVNMYNNNLSQSVPVTPATPLPVSPNSYPSGAAAITGNATGTTGAVVGTLAAASGKTTYICGFNVSAVGSAAGAVGPVTIAGLVGSSQVYQATAQTTGSVVAQAQFSPCIPGSAVNTAITITTTADATATAVDVNSWGYSQ